MDTLLATTPVAIVADTPAAPRVEPLLYDPCATPVRPVTFDTAAIVLPSSRLKEDKRVVFDAAGEQWVPIYCANCGVERGDLILARDWDLIKTFAAYLCDERHNDCAAKWSPLFDTCLVPDEVFFTKVHRAQLEAFGRELTAPEIVEALKDDSHILSKLARERGNFQAATL